MAQEDRLPALNALRAFEAAARHLSFTRAAEELNVTPGAISPADPPARRVRRRPLFRRTGRQVLLTDAGQAALPLLTSAFEMMAEAVHHMRAPARRDRLMISSAPSFAAKWLAPRLERFQEQNPEAEVWVSADLAITDFNSSDIDLALRYGKGIYEGLRSEKIMSESVLPVCSPDLLKGPHPLRSPADSSLTSCCTTRARRTTPRAPTGTAGSRRAASPPSTAIAARASRNPRWWSKPPPRAAASRSPSSPSPPATSNAAGSSRPLPTARRDIDFAYWIVYPKWRTPSKLARTFMAWLKTEAQAGEVIGV